MDRLRFGTTALKRARRKQRIRRAALAIWIISMLGVLVGAPITRTTALDLIQTLASGEGDEATAAVTVADGAGSLPGPEPTETIGRNTEKKKLPHVVARARRERRQAGGSSGSYETGSVTSIIEAAALEFGIEPGYLISIAECESGLDPTAYNSAGYHGLFQYDDTTWSAYGYGSIWDPVAQARTTAELLAAGQSSRWPNCA